MFCTKSKLALIALLFPLSALPSTSSKGESVEEYLKAFHANPAKMMDRLPSEVDSNGVAHPRGYIDYEKLKRIEEEKSSLREEIMKRGITHTPLSGIDYSNENKDRPNRLVEPGPLVTDLRKFEADKQMKAQPKVIPLSDTYWPLYKGMTGIRYNDPSFPDSGNWMSNFQYIQNQSATAIFASGNQSAINALSPSEKYDLAMGDQNLTLTKFAWHAGQKYYDEHGRVAKWMGYCHGWAGWAHMFVPIPESPITVAAPNGTPITFYPQDIKGLQSMLWANGRVSTRFVGNRCNTSKPPKNAYGRIIDPNCFDVNPGTWHLSITNQIGIHKRSFVLDSTFDAEVWNFPISGYRYSYFNPLTGQEVPTISGGAVPIEKFRIDPFKEFRSPAAKYVIGISMDMTHTAASNATRGRIETPPSKTLRYIYDLELDADYNIIGGEWYSNAHPDFIWTYHSGAQAFAPGDTRLIHESWERSAPVPGHWAEIAQTASATGSPLYTFLRQMVEPSITAEEAVPVPVNP